MRGRRAGPGSCQRPLSQGRPLTCTLPPCEGLQGTLAGAAAVDAGAAAMEGEAVDAEAAAAAGGSPLLGEEGAFFRARRGRRPTLERSWSPRPRRPRSSVQPQRLALAGPRP